MRFHEIKESYEDNHNDGKVNVDMIKNKYGEEIASKVDHFIKPENRIYRGMKATSNVIMFDGSKLTRKSANTENFYTLILDILPEWKHWPSRSKSLICATSEEISSDFGDIYYVIPLENQMVGICPDDDIWSSFGTLNDYLFKYGGLNDFNYLLKDMNEYLHDNYDGFSYTEIPQSTPTEMAEYVKYLETFMNENVDVARLHGNPDRHIENLLEMFNKNGVLTTFNIVLDPDTNGFEVEPANSLKMSTIPEREVWMSGKVMLINAKQFDNKYN